MVPVINVFGREISIYMLMGALGGLAMMFFGYKEAKKVGLDQFKMLAMFGYSAIGIILGGHLMYGVTMFDKLVYIVKHPELIDSFQSFVSAVTVVFGGSVYYGGLIGVLIVALIYCKARKLPLGEYFDVGAAAIPLFHFFGRLGCFFSGCCYGVPSEFGVIYHYSPVDACNGVRRFPVQLIEAILNLLLFFFLLYCIKRGFFKRRLMGLYCLIYPVYRFVLEYYRDDEYRGFLGDLSTSQFISLLFIAVTILILLYLNREKKPAAQTEPAAAPAEGAVPAAPAAEAATAVADGDPAAAPEKPEQQTSPPTE